MKIFENKTILVTGGAGSIGSVIVEKLLEESKAKQVRIFDQNEEAIFNLSLKFSKKRNSRFFVGSVRDKERISWALKDVDFVFHTAALKHVALNEYNPFEAIKTNILGTENVVMACLDNKVRKFINISTDKASTPTSTMGASKLMAERITTAVNYYKGRSLTVCASVRFGNVLASSGSVIPIFLEQIKKGGPITITDKRMVRYFMTIPQAVNLIFKATKITQGGEVFILKMPALKIYDLAEILIEELAEKYGYKTNKIVIKKVGIRPGEKVRESLVNFFEQEFTLEMKDMFVIPSLVDYPRLEKEDIPKKLKYYSRLGAKQLDKTKIKEQNILNKKQIKKLLKEAKII